MEIRRVFHNNVEETQCGGEFRRVNRSGEYICLDCGKMVTYKVVHTVAEKARHEQQEQEGKNHI